MRASRVWRKVLRVERTTVDGFWFEGEEGTDEEVLVISVRPTGAARSRCSRCGRRCRGYDAGGGVRRWRSLDSGTMMVLLEAPAPRVECRRCGVVVAAVPWARAGARFTHAFEDSCAWLAARAAQSVVCELMRVTWRTVAGIVKRVVADQGAKKDLLAGLRRIGIDEIAHRKGHRYLTCVVDHDTGRLVWAAPGRNTETLLKFFDALGPVRSAELTHVSADGAEWIHAAVAQRAPQAVLCLDPFHVVAWAVKALDEVRRQTWNKLRGNGDHEAAHELKGTRWALVKNPRAPRGARSYSRCSRERLEEISLGPMTYLDAERRRGQQHVRKLVTVSRYRNGAPGDPCDKAKAGLLESQFPAMQLDIRRKVPDTDAASCPGIFGWLGQPPGAGRCPMRVLKGTKRTPKSRCYVRPGRTWDRLRGASPMATECQ